MDKSRRTSNQVKKRTTRPTERDKRILRACLSHAKDLLDTASVILPAAPHLAFHFAVLALEELGKKTICEINMMARLRGDVAPVSSSQLDDHVAKLYWAFFGPSILTMKIDAAKIDSFRHAARGIHKTRMLGLYVEMETNPFRHPRNAISLRKSTDFLSFAQLTYDFEIAQVSAPRSERGYELASWLLAAGADPDRRGFVFREESLAKLREFCNYSLWIEWLQEEEKREQRSFNEFVRIDLEQSAVKLDDGTPRWEVKCRFYGNDLQFQGKAVKKWNAELPWARIELTGKTKQEIHLTLTHSDRVPAGNVYVASQVLAERILLALNIGGLAFCWWDKIQLTRRFYESCVDLDSRRPILFSEVPAKEVEWGILAMTEDTIRGPLSLAVQLPFPSEGKQYEPFALYLEGLSFYATVNTVRRHEYYAFRAFYEAYWLAVSRFLGVGSTRTLDGFRSGLPPQFQAMDGFRELFERGEQVTSDPLHGRYLTLADVASIKRSFDLCILGLIQTGCSLRAEVTQ